MTEKNVLGRSKLRERLFMGYSLLRRFVILHSEHDKKSETRNQPSKYLNDNSLEVSNILFWVLSCFIAVLTSTISKKVQSIVLLIVLLQSFPLNVFSDNRLILKISSQ